MKPILFTRFTAKVPVNKKITQLEDGSLKKESLAHQAYAGSGMTAEVCSASSLVEFGHQLDSLPENQCLAYGIPKGSAAGDIFNIVTKEQEKQNPQSGCISRSRNNFEYPAGHPGIMMFDYDPHESSYTPDELVGFLRNACPKLQYVQMIHRPSASSCITDNNGNMIQGVGGQRIYIAVSDASLIPEFAEILKARGWLEDHGRYEVSKAGSLLERNLFDLCVYQPERLDFSGQTVCGDGLRQILPPAKLVLGFKQFFDIEAHLSVPTEEERSRIEQAKLEAKAAVAEERQQIKAAFVEEKVQERIAKEEVAPDDDYAIGVIRRNVTRAIDHKVLHADFVIQLQDGEHVTVGELLDNPDKYHMRQCYDPLEPEYNNGDPRIGVIRLYGGRPHIYSHAHGGQRFRLVRAAREIEIIKGDSPRIIQECVELLKIDGMTYVYGDGDSSLLCFAPTANHGVKAYSPETLALKLDELADFYQVNNTGGRVSKDCPLRIAKTLLEAIDYWFGLPSLSSVVTHPICRPDGSLVSDEGYDPETGLLLVKTDSEEDWYINPRPDLESVHQALQVIIKPFRLFPFETAVDRAVFLAAMLTAVIRAAIKTAPAFSFDAYAPGTGKTLLAQCIGLLQTGEPPPAVAPPESEEEMQKILFSTLLAGGKTLLFDNVDAPLKSSSLCGFLTSSFFSGRILGVSKTASLPNRSLTLFTGNNIQINGDLNRRVLRCKLVADVERPDKREFDFCPLESTRRQRLAMIKALLTLVVAAQNSGEVQLHDVGSFNGWNKLVRHMVVWVEKTRKSKMFTGWWDVPCLADPQQSFDNGFDSDPELQNLGMLLSALWGVFGASAFSVAEMVEKAQLCFMDSQNQEIQRLSAAVNEIAMDRNNINRKSLGRYLQRYVGRIVDGLKLMDAGKNRSTKCKMWRIDASSLSGVSSVSGVSEAQYRKKVVNINDIKEHKQTPITPITPASDKGLQFISDGE